VTVEPTGTGRFARYRIEYRGRYWTGREWVADKSQAMLFFDLAAVGEEWNRIKADVDALERVTEFVVPLRVSVTSSWPLDLESLRTSLATRLRVEEEGIPVGKLPIKVDLDWEGMRALNGGGE
jgi:hypothetical protein